MTEPSDEPVQRKRADDFMNELATTQPQAVAVQQQKAPVLADDRGVKFGSMEEMWRFCVAVVNSGQIKDITTPEIALIRLQAGMELGLSPIWSLTNIMVTQGRPSVWGDALLGIVLNHPQCEDVIETFEGKGDEITAVCEVRRKGRGPVVRKFSVADAKKANLHGKNVHGLYPGRMLQMRARSWACRDGFADALRGLGVREELETVEKPVTGRVVASGIVMPDEPTPPSEPADQDGASEQPDPLHARIYVTPNSS